MVDENGVKSGPSDLELKIIRQVEYYFGDFNLSRDKFLKEAIGKESGWVPFETLVTFNRLKTLSADIEVVANALRKSPNQLLEINEDGSKVRRSAEKPLPADDEKRREDVMSRSVYVKGFPETLTLDELLEYFKQNAPTVEHVQMLYKQQPKEFKGSLFAVFKTVDDSKEFLSRESVKHGESELKRESKVDYKARKNAEWAQKKEEKKARKQDGEEKEEKKEPKIFEPERLKGCVLNVTELPSTATREDLKATFNPHGEVAWVDFSKGDKEAWVRFKEENKGADLQAKVTSEEVQLTMKDTKLTIRLLEGDEEKEFWDSVIKAKSDMKLQKQKGKRGGGRGFKGKGGRFSNRGQKRGAGDSENSNSKKVKTEDS